MGLIQPPQSDSAPLALPSGPGVEIAPAAPVDDGEALGAVTQAPPPLPFVMVDLAPFPFLQLVGVQAVAASRGAVETALAAAGAAASAGAVAAGGGTITATVTATVTAAATVTATVTAAATVTATVTAAATATATATATALLSSSLVWPSSTATAGVKAPLYATFPSFDSACDEYFSRLDVARAARAEATARRDATRRIDRIREGHAASLDELAGATREAYALGELLLFHERIVDAACTVVRSALDTGIAWADLERLVVSQAAAGNPVASRIAKMDLKAGKVILALVDEDAKAEAEAAEVEAARVGGGGR